MRPTLIYTAAAAALLLAACAPDQQEVPAEPEVSGNALAANQAGNGVAPGEELQPVDDASRPMPPSGPAGDEEMAWSFSTTDAGPQIAFGEPRTENARLVLRCPDDGQALLSFLRPSEIAEDRPDTLSIASGGSTRSLTMETQQGPLGTRVQAQAPLSSGPLQQFQAGNALEVRWGDETIGVPAPPEGPVRQFFEACA